MLTIPPIHLTPEQITWALHHPEYDHCLSIRGAEIVWEHIRNEQTFVGFAVDMNQFHALNRKLGRAKTNALVSEWLQLLRVDDLILGAGDEFLIAIPIEDSCGFEQRLTSTLATCGLHAYMLRMDLDHTAPLGPQFAAAQTAIGEAKERDMPPRWQFWRVNARVDNYRVRPSIVLPEERA